MATPLTVLCLSGYEKGDALLRECKRLGCTVLLLTEQSLEHVAWPRECIDEIYYMPSLADIPAVINGVSYLARSRAIDCILPLDEYEVPVAAALREHLRLPGMGESAVRFVRDKLAMRMQAQKRGVLVPEFVAAYNDEQVRAYLAQVPPPWLLKPRAEASTIGIAKLEQPEEVWPKLAALGDRRSFQLIERYIPGDVFHADSLIWDGAVVFASVGQYASPPLDVFHGGGISATRLLRRGSDDEQALQALNRQVVPALGLSRGVTHMEFIKGRADGRFYFLEVAARVGGAYIAEVIEAATGLNLWREWARIETASAELPYQLPELRDGYAGVIVSLARQETPDTSAYQDPEIVWRLSKAQHVGFIVASPDPERVETLLAEYARRIATDFEATLPPWTSRPPSTS